MPYTKDIARHDKITIDGTDVSNAFFEFNVINDDTEEDVSGFSASGNDETLPGGRAQSFTGQCFYTPELYALIYPLWLNRTAVEITWQPNGLVDPTREVWYGVCTIANLSPSATRGSRRAMPFLARSADDDGIVAAAAT